MAISVQDLSQWTTPGSNATATKTYDSVKSALDRSTELDSLDTGTFLQGSYANSTNTRGDSDVDVVVMLKSSFIPDLRKLTTVEKSTYESRHQDSTETAATFRTKIERALVAYYGSGRVRSKDKCLYVPKEDGYVDADVIPAIQVRKFTSYPIVGEPTFTEGIRIAPLTGGTIVNYPKEHIQNGYSKNKRTNDVYKPTVRQIKRLRRFAVDQGRMREDGTSSYVLECLVYNVPDEFFVSDDGIRVQRIMKWLSSHTAEELHSDFVSCDEIHTLFETDPGKHNQYTAANALSAMYGML
ncbi:MAG: nucleotidyltransferase [Candidatus Planktophila sp.]|nr:nucleotidyltransferase [Candidatus Planktophila sp.]